MRLLRQREELRSGILVEEELGRELESGGYGLPDWGLTENSPSWGAGPSMFPQVRVWSCIAAADWPRLGV